MKFPDFWLWKDLDPAQTEYAKRLKDAGALEISIEAAGNPLFRPRPHTWSPSSKNSDDRSPRYWYRIKPGPALKPGDRATIGPGFNHQHDCAYNLANAGLRSGCVVEILPGTACPGWICEAALMVRYGSAEGCVDARFLAPCAPPAKPDPELGERVRVAVAPTTCQTMSSCGHDAGLTVGDVGTIDNNDSSAPFIKFDRLPGRRVVCASAILVPAKPRFKPGDRVWHSNRNEWLKIVGEFRNFAGDDGCDAICEDNPHDRFFAYARYLQPAPGSNGAATPEPQPKETQMIPTLKNELILTDASGTHYTVSQLNDADAATLAKRMKADIKALEEQNEGVDLDSTTAEIAERRKVLKDFVDARNAAAKK